MMMRAAVLRRASELVGFDALSKRLGAGRGALACWMLLEGVPPARAFLEAADILFEHQLATLGRAAPRPSLIPAARAPARPARAGAPRTAAGAIPTA